MERAHLSYLPNYFLKAKRITRAREIRNNISEFKEYVELRKKYSSWIDDIKGPIFVPIDVTYRCNLRCPYCYVDSPRRSKVKELAKTELFRVFDELKKLDVLGTCLCGGEPTLREDLADIVAYARETGIVVNMVTNGVLMRENLISCLVDSGINTVQVSLDGSKPEIMDALRGQGVYWRALDAIKTLVDFGIPVIVSFCSTKINISDFPNVVELCTKLGVWSVRSMFFVPENENMLKLVPSEEQYRSLINWISDNLDSLSIYVEFGDPTEHIVLGQYIGHLSFSLSAEGYVLPSPYLSLAYGSVKDGLVELWDDLKNIWSENPVLRAVSENLNSEVDFVKLSNLLLTRKSGENIINLRSLNTEELLALKNEIIKVLRHDRSQN